MVGVYSVILYHQVRAVIQTECRKGCHSAEEVAAVGYVTLQAVVGMVISFAENSSTIQHFAACYLQGMIAVQVHSTVVVIHEGAVYDAGAAAQELYPHFGTELAKFSADAAALHGDIAG